MIKNTYNDWNYKTPELLNPAQTVVIPNTEPLSSTLTDPITNPLPPIHIFALMLHAVCVTCPR